MKNSQPKQKTIVYTKSLADPKPLLRRVPSRHSGTTKQHHFPRVPILSPRGIFLRQSQSCVVCQLFAAYS
jgi:hypothetical protein